MTTDCRFTTIKNMAPVVRCHESQLADLARRVRHIEKQLDTLGSPWWKRLWFRLDGWPPWWTVAERRARRPWRRNG